jgi:hypothetical protein
VGVRTVNEVQALRLAPLRQHALWRTVLSRVLAVLEPKLSEQEESIKFAPLNLFGEGYARSHRGYAELNSTAQRREVRWQNEVLTCKNHPYRRCNRSLYVRKGMKRCATCEKHRADGSLKPSYLRCKRRYEQTPAAKMLQHFRNTSSDHRLMSMLWNQQHRGTAD